jgi:hypothetical protein
MPAVQRADAAARRRALVAALAVAVAGVLAYFAFDAWVTDLQSRTPSDAAQALSGVLVWATAAVCVVVLAFAVYAWRLGRKAATTGRFPPHGMTVVRDTSILEGPRAIVRGRMLQAVAVVLIVAAAALMALVLQLAARLPSVA